MRILKMMYHNINLHIQRRVTNTVLKIMNSVSAIDILKWNSKVASSKWLEQHLSGVVVFSTRDQIQRFAINCLPGDFVEIWEFGIFTGNSSKLFIRTSKGLGKQVNIVGFDSFAGLGTLWSNPDHWNAFDQSGVVPKSLPEELLVVKGNVEETFPSFLRSASTKPSLIHFDLDLYEPTFEIVSVLKQHKFFSDLFILFDEHHGFPGWNEGEFRVLEELFDDVNFSYVAFGPIQALIHVHGLK